MEQPKFVSFEAEDGLTLDGLLVRPRSCQGIVIHVHGKCGNYYQNRFITHMLGAYPRADVGFLTFNNRGHDCIAEAYTKNGTLTYVGGSMERFEDCLLDLRAAIAFCTRWSQRIVLQGHSNGCEKALFLLAKQYVKSVVGVILLSPCDSLALHKQHIAPRSIGEQLIELYRLRSDRGGRELLWNQYGITTAGKRYRIPITVDALIGLLEGAALEIIQYPGPLIRPLQTIEYCVYLGGRDTLLSDTLPTIKKALATLGPTTFVEVPDGDHHFTGSEQAVCSRLAEWSFKALGGQFR